MSNPNLFACNTGRNPSIGWGDHFDFRNNVLFNWRHRTIDGADASSMVNIVANYFKPEPAWADLCVCRNNFCLNHKLGAVTILFGTQIA
jgi:hypothetical protein